MISKNDTIIINKKNRKILAALFQIPVRANISWCDIETMLAALGAVVGGAEGSRVLVELNGVVAVFHRLHLRKETDRGAIKSMRNFLLKAGVIL